PGGEFSGTAPGRQGAAPRKQPTAEWERVPGGSSRFSAALEPVPEHGLPEAPTGGRRWSCGGARQVGKAMQLEQDQQPVAPVAPKARLAEAPLHAREFERPV